MLNRDNQPNLISGEDLTFEIARRDFLRTSLLAAPILLGGLGGVARFAAAKNAPADLIVTNAKIATVVPGQDFAGALAVRDGRFLAVGTEKDIMKHNGTRTLIVDANGRTVIPGLNDSHTHVIRGGLNYNMELRWDGVPSLALALEMLKEQARRTPPPQWVRVVGGWSTFQFAERRMPTLEEINAAAPDTPAMVVHLYESALLNRAALRALGIDKDTPEPPGGLIQRDRRGNPTGMLIAKPNAFIIYSTIAQAPRLSKADQKNSSRHFMRELNRLGVTSVIDAGGGGQNYPEDYEIIQELNRQGQMTLRIAYNLFAQKPGQEFEDYSRWVGMTGPGKGDAYLRMNGAGENLVWSAADFENFLEPRPDLKAVMEDQLTAVVRLLAERQWPFRIHATYDETIGRFLDIFQAVNRDVPIEKLGWIIDHAETVSERNIERIKALGGGIAVQHRMAYQGEYFVQRYGDQAADASPPVRQMLQMGVPVGGGTDATRVSGYNPWIALYWLTSGKTLGGLRLYGEANRLDRIEALRLMTHGSAWFSREQDVKGTIEPGKYADFAVLSDDYFSVDEEKIKDITSVLTVLGGQVVFADAEFNKHGPGDLPVSPDWSPVGKYGGYYQAGRHQATLATGTVVAGQHLSTDSHYAHGHIHTVFGENGKWNMGCPCAVG